MKHIKRYFFKLCLREASLNLNEQNLDKDLTYRYYRFKYYKYSK